MMALLETRNLRKEYRSRGRNILALDDVILTVESGTFVSITGQSGSGKSSLLNLIAGLLLPTLGQVLIDGNDLSLLTDKKVSSLRNKSVGFIPQGYSLLSNLTVFDNVRLPFYLAKRKGNPDAEAENLLLKFGIEGLSSFYPENLSGGEIKRVAAARALVNKPALLLADEPTNDLDSKNVEVLIAVLKNQAKEGGTVIMVTHDSALAHEADEGYEMKEGRLKKVF